MNYPIIILVEPSHPGNVGAVARAMKTMGHRNLRLVNPKKFPDQEANDRASSALDILEKAKCYDSLAKAIADCQIVLAASNRPRTLNWPVFNPEQAARHLAATTTSAIVFGRESSGLSNDEINLCNGQITIPTFNDYQSLNLSHAVQILTYSCANLTTKQYPKRHENASHRESLLLKEHFTKTLTNLSTFNMPNPKQTISRLFCLINRAQPSKNELDLLRGILSAIDKSIKKD